MADYDNTLKVKQKNDPVVLNPNFEFDGLSSNKISSTEIMNHLEELTRQSSETKKENLNIFPVEAFPKTIQEIILATNESQNFPIDFIGASLLFAASVAIGNSHAIHNGVYKQNAVLFLALVGPRGTAKSHPLIWALKPIMKRDNVNYAKYQHEKKKYDIVKNLSKKEKQQQECGEPIKPFWLQHLVTDFTQEALAEVHKLNIRGIGVYSDEFASWFKNFNRYNKGSEEQFWLSSWSGSPHRVNRKNSDPINMPLPHIPVAGTIQPGVLYELAKGRIENGFFDRILYVFLENLKKQPLSQIEINPVIIKNWQAIISSILDLPIICDETLNPQPEILRFTSEAKKCFFNWQKKITDLCNSARDEVLSGVYAKLEQYVCRWALILEIMRFACGESNKKTIGIEAIRGALKLVEYFKNSAVKVHSIVSNTNPLDKLPKDKQNLYNVLPDYFTTCEGVQVAESLSIPERTFKYFISNRNLFRNTKRGEYEKRF